MADSTMTLKWDQDSERLYETGVKMCALYLKKNTVTVGDETKPYAKGVAWNGVTSIQESPSGADESKLYADDQKYLGLRAVEEFGATLEAYTYPDEFAACDGSAELTTGVYIGQQSRETFGLCYRTAIGNDTDGDTYGYKLHLVYGLTASPSSKQYQTINDSPEAITFSWELSSTPVDVNISGKSYKATSIITIDSTKFTDSTKLTALEAILYGNGTDEARLPLPEEVYSTISGS